MFTKNNLAVATAALLTAGSALSAPVTMITGWSDVNISTPDSAGAGYSIIYDRAPATPGASSSGRIGFDGEESTTPGLKVVNDSAPSADASNGDVSNCVMASSGANCNSERQSGKRFKLDRTGLNAIDLVFSTSSDGSFASDKNDGLYKVFQKFGNATGGSLPGFTASLGSGVGSLFQSSKAGDTLNFVDFGVDPKNSQFSSLFANGLFGAIDEEHLLNGYFDVNRSGYGLQLTSEDSFASTSMFGSYATLFGDLLSYAQVPNGFFYDNDGNADTDNVLLAHQLADGSWVQNRSLDKTGEVKTIDYGNNGVKYASLQELDEALRESSGLEACDANPTTPDRCLSGVDIIEDLAKFNLTFSIDPSQFIGSDFTLRFESSVPEPESLLMMLTALGLMAAATRRKKVTGAGA